MSTPEQIIEQLISRLRPRGQPLNPPRRQQSVQNTPPPRVLVGINYPWGNCGWDFGDGPWHHRSQWTGSIQSNLSQFRSLGIVAVRWFIFHNGIYYGLEQAQAGRHFRYVPYATPHLDPDPSRSEQWRLDVVPPLESPRSSSAGVGRSSKPLGPSVLEDFEKLLQAFQRFNQPRRQNRTGEILLLPSLISFEWGWPGKPHGCPANCPRVVWRTVQGQRVCAQQQCQTENVLFEGGRSDVINDDVVRPGKTTSKRDDFFNGVLEPLLRLSSKPAYKNEIFAWEIMNEPEGCTVMPRGLEEGEQLVTKIDDFNKCTVSEANMKSFLTEAVRRINASGFISTIGFRRLRTATRWAIPNVGFHQYHYYPYVTNGAQDYLTDAGSTGLSPIFLGEFGTNTNLTDRGWLEVTSRGVQDTVYGRLRHIQEKGYRAAFLWSAKQWTQKDQHTDWSSQTQNDVANYTSGL